MPKCIICDDIFSAEEGDFNDDNEFVCAGCMDDELQQDLLDDDDLEDDEFDDEDEEPGARRNKTTVKRRSKVCPSCDEKSDDYLLSGICPECGYETEENE